MLFYLTTKNKICNFFISLFTFSVSIISEQPLYLSFFVQYMCRHIYNWNIVECDLKQQINLNLN